MGMKPKEAIEKTEEAFGYSTSIHDDWKPYQEACDIAIKSLKKQIPITAVADCTEDGSREVFCRVCGQVFDIAYKHCHNCGQKIDWEGNNE